MGVEPIALEVVPRVVRTGAGSRLEIRAAPGLSLPADGTRVRVTITPMEGLGGGAIMEAPVDDGAIVMTARFPGEQEYVVDVESLAGAAPVFLGGTRVYAVADDLHGLRPWKADLHLHSKRSDGVDEPGEVAADCRFIGMDLAALTDHRLYDPSLEAIRAFEGCPHDLTLLPGEEVHPPDNPVHMVHVGGSAGVNAMFDDAYRREVDAIAAGLDGALSPADARAIASCLWVFRRIREVGGIGILAHPYWFTHQAWNVSEPVQAELYARAPFDALEIIGGYYAFQHESNTLQVARWQEERARGRVLPVVGASDAHGCRRGELFGWYYTIFFAAAPTLEGLRGALSAHRSVAVEARPGEAPRAFSPFRLAKYAHFLMREVLPAHDALCVPEGEAMRSWLGGDPAAAGRLAASAGAVARLYDRLWGAPVTP
jgi:hypothetical protein